MLPATIATTGLMKTPAVKWILTGGLFTVVLWGAYLIFRKVIQKAKRNNLSAQYGAENETGRALQYATQLYQAMFRSGAEWISQWIGDGTNTELIYNTAAQIQQDSKVGFNNVISAYKDFYSRDLLKDLQAELDADEFKKFNTTLSKGLSGLAKPLRIATVSQAHILDDKFQPLQIVRPGTMLGETYETLHTQNGEAYAIFYHNNQPRLVNANFIKEVA